FARQLATEDRSSNPSDAYVLAAEVPIGAARK
ncbi:MAG: hypothetical protein QOI86_5526, partial [Actinomycetota bacterium]|nr:hypothetical protein [Actinomycetota bacterium]